MTRPLAVLSEGLEGLVDEGHIALVDVEPQQAQAPRGTATDTVEELQRLTHHVVEVTGTVLMSHVVLQGQERLSE